MHQYENLRKGEKGAWLSISTYIVLSFVKLLIGYLGHSTALQADGLNNTTDIIASVAILVGLRISQKPPDGDHAYGHMRAETIASLVASFIMAVVGIQVLFNAGKNFFTGSYLITPSKLTAIVAILSGIIMWGVYLYNNRLAKEINSNAVKAAAYDNRSDALVSFGTAIGITAAILGFPIVDTLTAIIVGFIILKTAYEIFATSTLQLTDGFEPEEIQLFERVTSEVAGVIKVRDIKGRYHGNIALIDLTVTVNPNLNVWQSHKITEEIEKAISLQKPFSVVLIHIEPEGLDEHPNKNIDK